MENLLGLSRVYRKDEQEQLENEGISTIRGELKIAGRFLASPSIRLQVAQAAEAMGDSNWNILRAMEGEFIVPDNTKRMPMFPLRPTACLWYGPTKPVAAVELTSIGEVAWINEAAIEASTDYFFARELSPCPVQAALG